MAVALLGEFSRLSELQIVKYASLSRSGSKPTVNVKIPLDGLSQKELQETINEAQVMSKTRYF